MPIEVPTLSAIQASLISNFESAFSITIPALPQVSFFRTFSKVLSAPLWLLYTFGQRIMANQLPSTADGDRLDAFGAMFGSSLERIKAVNFIGTATFSREAGTTGDIQISAGTRMENPAGAEYTTLTDATLLDGNPSITLQIQSIVSGSAAAIAVGGTLVRIGTIANLQTGVVIATVTQQAQEGESNTDYRQRIIDRFSQRPQGGAKADYIAWAKEVLGVTRVFPFDKGFSTVELYFLRDNDGSGNGDRLPSAAEITAVENQINTPSRFPVGDFLRVLSPSERIFRLEVQSAVELSFATQDRVTAAAKNYFFSRVMYVDANLSAAQDPIISNAALRAQLVQVSADIIDTTIDEVGGASGISTVTLDRGEVGILDSTVSVVFTVI